MMKKAFFARKAQTIEVVKEDRKLAEQMTGKKPQGDMYIIEETVEMTGQEFKSFSTRMVTSDWDFLSGKGGFTSKGERKCIAVVNKETKQTLAIDPQGSTYARYTAIVK